MSRKVRRQFTDEFKQQIVDLYNAGKKRSDIIKEYDLTPSSFDKWVKQAKTTGSFKTIDNLTDEQRELIELRKRNKVLEMQVDILKQAAVIMAQKDRYGARKIKQTLETKGITISRRRIRRMMKRLNLVSVYQKASFKQHSKGKNEAPIPNHLERNFHERQPLEALFTDLTYVRVKQRWAYVCFIIDLYNREIIGLSIGWHKTAELVKQAIQSLPYALTKVQFFHSDRGKEFDNQLIDELLSAFNINRSLSQAGCPYDNAVVESYLSCF